MGRFSFRTDGLALCAATALLANVITAGACGGKAVVDPAATGGSGGSTTSSSGTGGTTSSTSTSTTTSSGTGGGPGSLCAEACSVIDPCLSVGTGCVDSCNAAIDGCAGAQDAYLMCVIEAQNVPMCGAFTMCASALWDFLDCKDVQDTGGGCATSPNGDCECQIEDNQGNLYEAYCSAGEENKCECAFNWEPIGQCSNPGPSDCDPLFNCCTALFFVPALPG